MDDTATAPDWHRWYSRWEAQQTHYMPDREERFAVVTDAVASLAGDAPRVVDLGCGPGSLAQRVVTALPGARVMAVDMDPVLLAIGRHAIGDAGGRLRFVDSDLRAPWERELEAPVDAVVSATALHWLQPDALAELYARLASVLRPGGAFLNADHLGFDAAAEPRLAAAEGPLRDRWEARRDGGGAATGEEWDEWWSAVRTDPGLAPEVAERERRHHDHPDHDHDAGLAFHTRALREAGFAEVGTLWQRLTARVLVAIR